MAAFDDPFAVQKDIEKESQRAVPRIDAVPPCPVCKMFHDELCKLLNRPPVRPTVNISFKQALEKSDEILSDYLGPKHPIRSAIKELM